jgi:molybdopterin-binding protein
VGTPTEFIKAQPAPRSKSLWKEKTLLKISGRNQIRGNVVSLETDGIMAKVKVDIGAQNIITSTITKEAVDDLGIAQGDQVGVLIKASSVMITK